MRVVILGAGISGHTAALVLRRRLPDDHEIVVVTPNSKWNWIPSNIWVGVGKMTVDEVSFELAPMYARQGIVYAQGKATELHPEGGAGHERPFVVYERTGPDRPGERAELEYDYLINATGPRLNFAATPGLWWTIPE
jgi:sulfide:quinone oxidoreductase